jgi:predicted dehydrogenase
MKMKKTDGKAVTRRKFLQGAGAGVALFTIVPRHVLGGPENKAPSDKIRLAGIGVGGQGGGDLNEFARKENAALCDIVALCDVDERSASGSFKKFPNAKRFTDFRKMFDEMDKDIDAVLVATPDHTHAVACMAAIARGKHLYCEKPLAHSVYEARMVTEAARKAKVVTQLGNQGHSDERIRQLVEWVRDGAIGQVKEVHAGTDAFKDVYCQTRNLPKMAEKPDVPKELNWDLWLGPVAERAYHPMYLPFNWRGWTAFGTGAIGDWFCHVVDPSFWALDLGAPKSIQAEVDGYDPKKDAECYPAGVKVTYEFAAKDKRGPVTLYWYDGNKQIPHPDCLEKDRKVPGTGAVLIGEKGGIQHGSHGAGGARIIPDQQMKDYKQPAPSIPRAKGHHQEWLLAIGQKRQADSNFDYGGPLTELGLLGMIAIRMAGQKLEWDAEKMQFPNCAEANQYVAPKFREGWKL